MTKYLLATLFPLLFSCSFLTIANTQLPIAEQPKAEGKLIWADLYSSDVNASIEFYTNTFGWTVKHFDKQHERYHLLFDNEQAIAGVLTRSTQRNKTESALWVGSVKTDNVATRASKAAENNATIILKPHDFSLYGKRAVIADPQGGVIALLDLPSSGASTQKISNKWSWAQLFSVDTKKSAAFYQASLNYTAEKVDQTQDSYYLSQQDEVMASIVKLPLSFEQRNRWVNFLEINNLTNTLALAVKNGAEIVYQPQGRGLAIIADPSGALLGLTQQESE
ncbi:VOC family protein [Thalassotalea sp. PLHSN55]|uniref:VOC family protein n=1 Tax=Thalassotalea sp. PLHSN55 TaxID=3435888 RepID=UPI003F865871